MSWQAEVEELKRRQAFAAQMGGPEGIARQHAHGELAVRERIAALVDPGSFREFMGLAGSASYDERGALMHFTPKGAVDGSATLDGPRALRRKVHESAALVVAGAAGEAHELAEGAGIDQ